MMDFRIADTFTDSLSRLTGDEQKAVKTTAFDLQMNSASPGMQFHKLERARDRNFWSIRVNADIRLIVHKIAGSLLLCYVDHHDKAYDWAERRKLETHPKTGAAQLVEIRETVKEVVVPVYVPTEQPAKPKPKPCADRSADELLSFGVPAEWIDDVRAADEDQLLVVAERMPSEAAEALLEIATGGRPRVAPVAAPDESPFEHPDAQRRFRLMTSSEELERALEFPWDKWTIFLHPEQRGLVEHPFSGPARVMGSAGTGKTIVALHRAAFLARAHPEARVLLATFSQPLANALSDRLRRLVGNQPRLAERIEVHALDAIVLRLYRMHVGSVQLIERQNLVSSIRRAADNTPGHNFKLPFLCAEWDEVIDAWQLDHWDEYRSFARLGRKSRLTEPQREVVWAILSKAKAAIQESGGHTTAQLFNRLAILFKECDLAPFDFVVVDEAQDLSVTQLRFLAALGARRSDSLFFAGDLGQRIFQTPFSWKALGVDVRGRSRTLKVNYRTSHQIRAKADSLLNGFSRDVDGVEQDRTGTVSVFNGATPSIRVYGSPDEECTAAAAWIKHRVIEGVAPHEIAVFFRSDTERLRAVAIAEAAKMPFRLFDESLLTTADHIAVGPMHLAKGLEFRAVAVVACDADALPCLSRVKEIGDSADLEDVYTTERHLLYVACTRARDHLLISGCAPASEFLDDLLVHP